MEPSVHRLNKMSKVVPAGFLGLYYAVALLWYGYDKKDNKLVKTSLWTLENI